MNARNLLGIIIVIGVVVGAYQTGILTVTEVYQWEFAPPMPERDYEPQCAGMLSGQKCYRYLILVKRVNGKVDKDYISDYCCYDCELGRSWCLEVKKVFPGMVTMYNFPFIGFGPSFEKDYCDPANTDDFYGNNLKALQHYLNWLVREYGSPADLNVGDVKVNIDRSEPPVLPGGDMVAGYISKVPSSLISMFGAKWQVNLYEKTLTGEPKAQTYNTIAHEFKHILQVIEHNLNINDVTIIGQYEREAEDFANYLAPLWPCL